LVLERTSPLFLQVATHAVNMRLVKGWHCWSQTKERFLALKKKLKLIREIEYGKNRTKITSVFEQNGLRMKCFKRLNEMMSMRWCISGLFHREVKVHQSVFFFS